MLPAKNMFNALATPLRSLKRSAGPLCLASKIGRSFSSEVVDAETPEEFDKRFIDFFNQPNIDSWLVRKGEILVASSNAIIFIMSAVSPNGRCAIGELMARSFYLK